MNNQSNIPKVYHGKWKVPQYDSWRTITSYQEYMGTLTCDGKKNTLEVYHYPKHGLISSIYAYHEVIFGCEANGYVFKVLSVRYIIKEGTYYGTTVHLVLEQVN